MTSDEERSDPFNLLKEFLATIGKLDENDATIYVLGLKKGKITSGRSK
jgi:hypothetical protein